jgi:Bacterial regulatory helix-turn-helix protein, lysR family
VALLSKLSIVSEMAISRQQPAGASFPFVDYKELMQLEMFVAVAEERSFLRAAERVFRTQPAISIGIRKLEGELVFLCRIVRIGGVGG